MSVLAGDEWARRRAHGDRSGLCCDRDTALLGRERRNERCGADGLGQLIHVLPVHCMERLDAERHLFEAVVRRCCGGKGCP